MPRVSKMAGPVKDGDGTFYWPDTGPVQYTAEAGEIVMAKTVERLAENTHPEYPAFLLWSWSAS